MTAKIIERILRESGVANLVELLGQELPPTDLQSLLLEVFRRRAAQQTPRRVLEQYEQNPFVRPATVDPIALNELERLAYTLAQSFVALELAPLAPLGVSSALAPVDQNKVVSTIRNTEVVSDATNVLALECVLRRRKSRDETTRLLASLRLVRAQRYTDPNARAHFRMISLCTAGRAAGIAGFEIAALNEHIGFYLRFLAAAQEQGYTFADVRVPFIPLAGDEERAMLEEWVIAPLAAQFPTVRLAIDPEPSKVRDYYEWVRFGIYASDAGGAEYMIGDGGCTDWTRKLLSDRRERLLTSGIAVERIVSLFRPANK